jgi:hypothetical protein
MSGEQIIKVQRHHSQHSLATTEPFRHWLMYDEERVRQVLVSESELPEFVIELMGDDYKMFCYATWTLGQGWGITSRVPKEKEPDW